MGKKTQNFWKYFVELLVVAFGVVLGLLVTEWNSNRNTNKDIAQTMIHIVSEIEENIARLNKSIIYHDTLCYNIDNFLATIPEDEFLLPYYQTKYKHFRIKGWKGTGIASMQSIVYESAKLSGFFQEADLESIRLISKVYKVQEGYLKIGEAPIDNFMGMDSNTKLLDVVGILEILCSDIKNSEISARNMMRDLLIPLKEKNL